MAYLERRRQRGKSSGQISARGGPARDISVQTALSGSSSLMRPDRLDKAAAGIGFSQGLKILQDGRQGRGGAGFSLIGDSYLRHRSKQRVTTRSNAIMVDEAAAF